MRKIANYLERFPLISIKRIDFYIEVLLLNPKVFFQKGLERILIMIVPVKKKAKAVKIGSHTIITYPYRNIWWKSIYLKFGGVEIIDNLKKHLKPKGVFIDVGSCIGYYSAIASKIVGDSGQVHCFEPFPKSTEIIRSMINKNPKSNIILNDFALSDEDGTAIFYNEGQSLLRPNSKVNRHKNQSSKGKITVRTKRLDDYLEEKGIDNVSLIKIDVEGYEYCVLKGMRGFFEKSNNRPPIICEVVPDFYKQAGLSLNDLENFMRSYNYEAYNIFNQKKRVVTHDIKDHVDVIFMAINS